MKQSIANAWRRYKFEVLGFVVYSLFVLLVIVLAISLLLVCG